MDLQMLFSFYLNIKQSDVELSVSLQRCIKLFLNRPKNNLIFICTLARICRTTGDKVNSLDMLQREFKRIQHLVDPDLLMLPVSDLTVFLQSLRSLECANLFHTTNNTIALGEHLLYVYKNTIFQIEETRPFVACGTN